MRTAKILKNLFRWVTRSLRTYCLVRYWTPNRIWKYGTALIEKINRERPENSVIVYAGPFMGDALYAMAFVEAYKRQNPDKTVIILASSTAVETLVKTFTGYDRIVLLSKHQNTALRFVLDNIKIALMAKENAIFKVPVQRDYFTEYPNVIDRLRYRIFEVGEDAPIQYHRLALKRVTSIPDFYGRCGKIVVLNPYSNTCHLSKAHFYMLEGLVRHLKNRGYTVYTNVINDQLPIRGTEELRCGLSELLEIANHIPLFISLRSGILDFIVKTNVNMFVLYAIDEFIPLYSLKAWNSSGLVKEVTFSDFLSDTHFENIDAFLRDITVKGSDASLQPSQATEGAEDVEK